MEKKRSIGITLFSISFFIVALYLFYLHVKYWELTHTKLVPYTTIIVHIFLGVGAFQLKPWFHKLLYVYTVIAIGGYMLLLYYTFFVYLSAALDIDLKGLLNILLYPIALYYFTRPKVKEQFR